MDGRDKEECTPLHRAAEYGNLEAVKWFVNNGSDFNAVDKSNLTPLQKAQKEEFVDVVHWMKEYKKNEAMVRESEVFSFPYSKLHFLLCVLE